MSAFLIHPPQRQTELTTLFEQQLRTVKHWLPAITAGVMAWFAFLAIADTPLIRSSGLALTIVGITLSLRRMGAILAVIGGMTLALSPAFWSQTGGAQSQFPAPTVLAALVAGTISLVLIRITKRPYITLGLGLFVFAVIFWSQIGTPRSLRLTGLLTAWLLVILIEALLASNPRPDGPPPQVIKPQQYFAILIVLFVGVINDPLFVLLVPAIAIGLWLSNTSLALWYWLGMLLVAAIGIHGLIDTYVDSVWWSVSSVEAHESGVFTRYLIADGWREGVRWIDLIKLIVKQTTIIGAILSVLGLTRMTRWYPVLGTVLMIAFASYAVFGLVYFGLDREVLLMPLFIIQVIWLTYAVFASGQWLLKSDNPRVSRLRWAAYAAYLILPAYLLTEHL